MAFLALVALLVISKGLILGWSNAKDLRIRWQEWQLFQAGFYPIGGIYGANPPPGMRSSPYPAWAIPLFALFFFPGGLYQGIFIIQILSLMSMAFIAWIGYHHLRPYGKVAGCFGALGTLAISGNANALAVAQFSIACMGLVFLEWGHLRQQRFRAAGLFWALAMIKPQIALLHGTPLLGHKGNRGGLWSGLLALALLSGIAFLQTGLSPLIYVQRFPRLLKMVQDDSGWNLSLQLTQAGLGLWLGLGATLLAVVIALRLWYPVMPMTVSSRTCPQDPQRWMLQAGLCGVLGYFAFYHRSTDHIMFAPALLAMAELSWRTRQLGIVLTTLLLGASLWIPGRVILGWPILGGVQLGIWVLCVPIMALALICARSPGTVR
jgi:hypothetical protein